MKQVVSEKMKMNAHGLKRLILTVRQFNKTWFVIPRVETLEIDLYNINRVRRLAYGCDIYGKKPSEACEACRQMASHVATSVILGAPDCFFYNL